MIDDGKRSPRKIHSQGLDLSTNLNNTTFTLYCMYKAWKHVLHFLRSSAWAKGDLWFTCGSNGRILIHCSSGTTTFPIIKDIGSYFHFIVGWELAWAINPKYRVFGIRQCPVWQPGNEIQLCYYTFNGDNQQWYSTSACSLPPAFYQRYPIADSKNLGNRGPIMIVTSKVLKYWVTNRRKARSSRNLPKAFTRALSLSWEKKRW